MKDSPSPRSIRLELAKLEAWFRAHENEYDPQDRLDLRTAFELANKAGHVAIIKEALRTRRNVASYQTGAQPQIQG